MRVIALLAQLLVALTSGGAFAWWVATAGMRLLVRRLERFRPLRDGPVAVRAAVLAPCALPLSAVAVAGAWELFRLLDAATGWAGVQRPGAVRAWHVVTALAAALLAPAGVGAAVREALVALGAPRRRWYLVGGTRTGAGGVLDGNHLPGSEKRLAPLQGHRGAALPGQSLVVHDPDLGLVVDMVAQETRMRASAPGLRCCWMAPSQGNCGSQRNRRAICAGPAFLHRRDPGRLGQGWSRLHRARARPPSPAGG